MTDLTLAQLSSPVLVGSGLLFGFVFGELRRSRAEGQSASPFPTIGASRRAISRELNHARRVRRPLSVVLLRFEGERSREAEFLAALAEVGRREIDLWIGGPRAGETLIVAPETGPTEARGLLERLAAALPDWASVGLAQAVATFPDHGLTFEVLLERCEETGRRLESVGSDATQRARLRA